MPIIKRAKVLLYPQDLHAALGLRTDISILAMHTMSKDPPVLELVLFSPTFAAQTEREESPVVALHAVSKHANQPQPPLWRYPCGGPGQQPWLCPAGHILASDGVYNNDNIEWYAGDVRPSYGCRSCSARRTGPNFTPSPERGTRLEHLARAATNKTTTPDRPTWTVIYNQYNEQWRRQNPVRARSGINWVEVHRIRYAFYVDRYDQRIMAGSYAISVQAIRRLLSFRTWPCLCDVCLPWNARIDEVSERYKL